ncbi:MAG: PAS domain-containing sensor histidine kinase [Bryobacterales bacterium]|nr:PAS domain-containing sensor histidine kinase [Bryobacterales bacterium]
MNGPGKRKKRKLAYESRLTLLALAGGAPALLTALAIVWLGDYTPKAQWTLTLLLAGFWLGCAMSLRERVVRPLQTLSNLVAALREGDYSMRARSRKPPDALDEVFREVNLLAALLEQQRLSSLDASALLRAVMEEIDVAVFTFNADQRLKLVNRAGERLLAQPGERLLGRTAGELGLAGCLEGGPHRTLDVTFPERAGRWGVRVSRFRESGVPHQLLVIEDLTRTLREEELQAWKRLVRVLGHELNNSLTPIRSIAGSLSALLRREPLPEDWREDAQSGLSVIGSRAEALNRFMEAYARLAKLPPPRLGPVNVAEWVRRSASLETRRRVDVAPGPPLVIQGDGDQLDQLLINLIRNAVDAVAGNGGEVRAGWRPSGAYLEVWVEDDGPGLPSTQNLFVPFFTTKPGGSGIGLILCRQIAEGHGGVLTLENRAGGRGCQARVRLPL